MYSEFKLINLPLSYFPSTSTQNLSVSTKLTNHPYYIRYKVPIDSFPDEGSHKKKATTCDKNEEISFTDGVVAQTAITDQNELIMQLIAEMRIEIQRRQYLPPPGFAVNASTDGWPL